MTVSFSDIADALRWVWLAAGIVWIAFAWLHRVSYTRVLLGLGALIALDILLHAFADFAERPDSNIPSDFALYSVMVLLAAIAGLSATCLYARWRKMNVWTIIDAALVCVIVGGIGGRLYQVAMNWNYYSENTDVITDLAQGGFGMRGALIFGFIALFLFATITHNSFWQLADAAVIGLSLAQSIGWYGAYLTHTHYGIALDAPPVVGILAPFAQMVRAFGYNFVQDLPDAYNLIAFRIPVQLFAALFFGVLFVVLLYLAQKHPDRAGYVFTCYVLLASLVAFVFGFWRGDETLWWNGLRVDQWFDLGIFIFGLALLWLRFARVKISQPRMVQHA